MSGTRVALAGAASFTINGDPWNVVGDLEYRASGPKLETLKGQSAVEGFSLMPEEGYISVTLRDRPDRKLSAFKGASGITATAQLVNGKVLTLTDGWVTELGGLKTQEGTFDLRLESDDVTDDILASAA